jgi:hypothetical protein
LTFGDGTGCFDVIVHLLVKWNYIACGIFCEQNFVGQVDRKLTHIEVSSKRNLASH